MKTILVTALALALGIASPLVAGEEGAAREARSILAALRNLGMTVRDQYHTGYLSEGSSYTITTTLYSDTDYAIVAGGDENALDVDVKLYDENWNLIAQDNDRSDRAVARVSPRWDGTFHIVVTMASTSGRGARYVVQTGFSE